MLVQRIGDCRERQYTDRNGQPQTFAERCLLLSDGLNTFNAILTGDAARRAPTIQEGTYAAVQLSFRAHSWTSTDGSERYETICYIDRIAAI